MQTGKFATFYLHCFVAFVLPAKACWTCELVILFLASRVCTLFARHNIFHCFLFSRLSIMKWKSILSKMYNEIQSQQNLIWNTNPCRWGDMLESIENSILSFFSFVLAIFKTSYSLGIWIFCFTAFSKAFYLRRGYFLHIFWNVTDKLVILHWFGPADLDITIM